VLVSSHSVFGDFSLNRTMKVSLHDHNIADFHTRGLELAFWPTLLGRSFSLLVSRNNVDILLTIGLNPFKIRLRK